MQIMMFLIIYFLQYFLLSLFGQNIVSSFIFNTVNICSSHRVGIEYHTCTSRRIWLQRWLSSGMLRHVVLEVTHISEVHVVFIIRAWSTFETSVSFYQTTRRNIPEDSHLHIHRSVNLKSYQVKLQYLYTATSVFRYLAGPRQMKGYEQNCTKRFPNATFPWKHHDFLLVTVGLLLLAVPTTWGGAI
jgi:hypothetical protein